MFLIVVTFIFFGCFVITELELQHTSHLTPHTPQNPPHWHLDLGQHYCDHLGRSFIFLTCIECLEGEDWKLRGTNCMTHYDSARDTTKFFFHRD